MTRGTNCWLALVLVTLTATLTAASGAGASTGAAAQPEHLAARTAATPASRRDGIAAAPPMSEPGASSARTATSDHPGEEDDLAAQAPPEEATGGRPAAGPPPSPAFLDVDRDAAESMQRLAEEKAAQARHPGRRLFDASCATCHDGGVSKAPHRSMIAMMTPAAILHSLEAGTMKQQAAELTPDERRQVAEYLAGSPLADAEPPEPAPCAAAAAFDPSRPPVGGNWGITRTNTRSLPAAADPVPPREFADLELKWAFAYPGANRARSQPGIAGGAVHVGAQNGRVYALDQETGCLRWRFQASGEVRTAIVIEPWEPPAPGLDEVDALRPRAFFGDVLGNVYALDLRTGALLWRDRPEDHPNATITGSPSYHEGGLYVPVSSLETGPPTDPGYACCRFRGSVVAYDAASGARLWQTHTVATPPAPTGRNAAGTEVYGPSGAAVWNSPAIDAERGRIYFGTAQNLSSPATTTSDAVFAVDMASGEVVWTFQGTPDDAWNGACDTDQDANCPREDGPDFDFGAGVILATTREGRDLVIGGQKSGMVHALDPATGRPVWQRRVGRGGIQGGIHFGMAARGGVLFVPVSDMPDGRSYPHPARPGLYALDLSDGAELWSHPMEGAACEGREFCHAGISQAVTAAPGVVLAGGMDGVLRVHDSGDGTVIWHHDTTRPVTTLTGTRSHGGSHGGGAGPVSADGMLFVSSGYGLYFHMPGNVLLAFGPPEDASPAAATASQRAAGARGARPPLGSDSGARGIERRARVSCPATDAAPCARPHGS